MYIFYDKNEKTLDKFMNIWEKISNIIKSKFNNQLI